MTTTFLPTVPQVFVDVDRDKVLKQGVDLGEVYQTLQAFMGGYFVNYFNRFGRQWQVYVQAEGEYRTQAEKLGQFYVRNARRRHGAAFRPDLDRAALRAGVHHALQPLPLRPDQRRRRAGLQLGPGHEGAGGGVCRRPCRGRWATTTWACRFQEKKAQEGVPVSVIFGLSLLFVFLILAAQYESWSLPFSVLLGTPDRRLRRLRRRSVMRHMEINVYAQIGLVMLIGLAAKNAILIVEFAKVEYEKGKSVVDAALEGARLRLRPILMTSFAFILGCVPLAIATGAGAVSRQVMGTGVIGGMLAASFIAIFLIPMCFYVVEKLSASGGFGQGPHPGPGSTADEPEGRGACLNGSCACSVLLHVDAAA